ncbi:unnamed protein product [Rhizophagus irregularis]|nr:unnamed protein product [Rhizophagus irregularis]
MNLSIRIDPLISITTFFYYFCQTIIFVGFKKIILPQILLILAKLIAPIQINRCQTKLSRRRPDRQKKNFKGNDKTKITKFHRFVTRGTKVGIDEEFHIVRYPLEPGCHSRYITTESSAEFCDEPVMKLLGTLSIELPDVHLGLDRKVEFSLIFGKLDLVAKAKNLRYRRIYDTSFELDF